MWIRRHSYSLKKKEKQIISMSIAITAVATIVGVIYYYNLQTSVPEELKTQWIISGPFAIDKPKYKLGENIFLVVSNLKPDETGWISFVRPNGLSYTDIPFNGTLKDHFTFYFTPTTSVIKKIYKPEQLVGTWTVIFHGVTYQPLKFEIENKYIQGGEANVPPLEEINKTSE